jgi:ribosomal protein L1
VKIGLREFENEKILSNLDAVARALVYKRPESVKGKYFLKGYLKSTMGSPVRLDLSQY